MIQIDKNDFIYKHLIKLGVEENIDEEYVKFAQEGITNSKDFNNFVLASLGMELLTDFDDSVLEETLDYYADLKKVKAVPQVKLNHLLKEYHLTKSKEIQTEIVHAKLKETLLIACGYKLKHLDINLNDLVQTCNIGLIIAVDKYVPDNKIPFDAYLHYWILDIINKEFTLGEQNNG